jgi:hypothetical protein
MRTLGDAERAGKFRYIVATLAPGLLENGNEVEVELFFRSLGRIGGEQLAGRWGAAVAIFCQCLRCALRRRRRGLANGLLRGLCLFPSSTFLLRCLLKLCWEEERWQIHRFAIARALGYERLSDAKKRQLCRALLRARRPGDGAELAKLLLRARPDDAEARHLLWSALLQMDGRNGAAGESEERAKDMHNSL